MTTLAEDWGMVRELASEWPPGRMWEILSLLEPRASDPDVAMVLRYSGVGKPPDGWKIAVKRLHTRFPERNQTDTSEKNMFSTGAMRRRNQKAKKGLFA